MFATRCRIQMRTRGGVNGTMRTNYMRRMRDIVRSTRRKKGDVERDRGLDEKERARDDLAGASIFFDSL